MLKWSRNIAKQPEHMDHSVYYVRFRERDILSGRVDQQSLRIFTPPGSPIKRTKLRISVWAYIPLNFYQNLIVIGNQGMKRFFGDGGQLFSKLLQVPDINNHRLPKSLFAMLLAFAVISFVKRYGAQAVPLPSRALDMPTFVCDEIPYEFQSRSILNILWSCLVTTFACTWVCVHPNVPFRKEDSWTILGRRAFLMFFSIIAPEFMVIWAFKQWRGARMITEAINEAFPDSRTYSDVSQSHLYTNGAR